MQTNYFNKWRKSRITIEVTACYRYWSFEIECVLILNILFVNSFMNSKMLAKQVWNNENISRQKIRQLLNRQAKKMVRNNQKWCSSYPNSKIVKVLLPDSASFRGMRCEFDSRPKKIWGLNWSEDKTLAQKVAIKN